MSNKTFTKQEINLFIERRSHKGIREDEIRKSQPYENTYFDFKRNTRIKTDASHDGLGVSLEQLHGNNWKTVSFASTFLISHDSKFSKNELEPLGVVWAKGQYKNYLYGSDQNLKFLTIIKLSFRHSYPTIEIKLILVV